METRLQQFMRVLRALGAGLVIAAASTFLFQQWEGVGYIVRYSGLLALTALLPLVAYFCGIRLEEGRSARVLMTTMLSMVPLHAGVLGGFVFSTFGDPALVTQAAIQWIAPNKLVSLLIVAGASVVLAPFVWSAFRTLARPDAKRLTAVFLATNALSLLPTRESTLGGLVVFAMGALTALGLRGVSMNTLDRKLAGASLVGPVLLVLSRQLMFYDASSAYVAGISLMVAAATFIFGSRFRLASLERVAVIPAALGLVFVADALDSFLRVDMVAGWMVAGLGSSAVYAAFALLSEDSKRFFVNSAVASAAVSSGFALLCGGGALVAIAAILSGLVVVGMGFMRERRPLVALGGVLSAAGLCTQIAHAIRIYDIAGWPALAALGVAIMIGAAWIERRASVVRANALREASLIKDAI